VGNNLGLSAIALSPVSQANERREAERNETWHPTHGALSTGVITVTQLLRSARAARYFLGASSGMIAFPDSKKRSIESFLLFLGAV
jgi:hypothetical protein